MKMYSSTSTYQRVTNVILSKTRRYVWIMMVVEKGLTKTGRVWQPQRLVFQILYKRHSTPTLVGCWFLTVFITFWQPLKLSPTSLCEIQVLGARFLGWVKRFVLWTLILSLEHFELRQALVKHLLLLEVKPPRWLGVALELPSMWWVLGKFVKVRFTSERKEVRA
jgi:hypothetical protein